MATGNIHSKFGDSSAMQFSSYASGQTDKQTNRQTDIFITILCTPGEGLKLQVAAVMVTRAHITVEQRSLVVFPGSTHVCHYLILGSLGPCGYAPKWHLKVYDCDQYRHTRNPHYVNTCVQIAHI